MILGMSGKFDHKRLYFRFKKSLIYASGTEKDNYLDCEIFIFGLIVWNHRKRKLQRLIF